MIWCSVPFCGAHISEGDPKTQWWVCRDHWRDTDKRLRKRLKDAKRKGHKRIVAETAGLLRCQAIERAVGIG